MELKKIIVTASKIFKKNIYNFSKLKKKYYLVH
jgi:hypothetical protein